MAKVKELATQKDCTPGRAVDVELSAEDLATIDDEIPAAAGDRYDPTGMATVQQ